MREYPTPREALVAAAADDGYTPVGQGQSRAYYGYRYLGYFYGAGVLSYGKVKRGRG